MASKLDGKYDDPEDIKRAREAAKKKGNKTFTVDGLRYDTATGRRKPLSAAPLLESTQKRIDYEKDRDGDIGEKRLAKEKRKKERIKRNRERAKANPSLLKGGSSFSKGGLASAAKTIAGKTTRSRNKTKPRGVGVATRGYGKALK